ncbi:MAG: diaminopropionate ammonia-lyase [Schwartzia sp.]|nr:diaminopropionate ammonia-lyase [Schwartzia sp. (in: firmicutes)]
MRLTTIRRQRPEKADISFLSEKNAEGVRAFHASFPMYAATPLRPLAALARELGVRGFYVKDESFRFGLNAFKVLGGSYAAGRYLAQRLGVEISDLPYGRLTAADTRDRLGPITFVTTTDGNHGRGVAWTARELGQRSVVYMPRGTRPERLENIRREGAEASILPMGYDDAVRFARRQAEENGWVLLQDTSFPGYREVPAWIMAGYGTMALEIYRQIPEPPTHIFLQAGVGSMAGAVTGFFANVYPGPEKPVIVIVEPETADCVFRTAQAADGQLHAAPEPLVTIMAGLACGEVCDMAWGILESWADFALAVPDEVTVRGMRRLARPLDGDPRVVSGESGAVTTGAVEALLTEPDYAGLRRALRLDEQAVILCVSTEGATDKENYRHIVGEGVL